MGLFNWGKKKKTQGQEIDEAFAAFGAETNEVKQPGKESRKETAANAQAARLAEVKKEQLLEKMNELRKALYGNPNFNDHSLRLEDAIAKLKRMADNADKVALNAVDNFMLQAINNGINYCNRDSWVGMGACIDVIENLINDRFQCGEWVKDPQYIKARLTADKIYVEIKDLESRIASIQERGASLKEKYNDPKFKAQQQSLMNEMLRLKNERETLTVRINNLTKENEAMQRILSETETRVSAEIRARQFDLQNEADNAIEMQRENEARNYATERILDKFNTSTARHTDSSLTVDGSLGESSVSAPQIDIDSLGF